MNISLTDVDVAQVKADGVAVGIYADGSLTGPATRLDEATGGVISRLIEAKELTGKASDVTPLLAPAGVACRCVVVVGLGDRKDLDRGTAYRAAAAAARHLAGKERSRVAFYLGEEVTGELAESAVCGAIVGCQGQDLYRAEKKRHPFEELIWAGVDAAALQSGEIIGQSVNLARRFVNEPAQTIYPETLAHTAWEMAESSEMEVEVWDQQRLEAGRCGALLGVAGGIERPPRLVILRYQGGGEAPPLALVGKGVTFDSGGYSLKTNDGMKTMKCDMAGAAAVIAAMQAIARLKLPVNVVGLAGLVENLVSGASYKLGDVLTARNGKTIEVLNTDAEGRLVLADVLSVAVDQNPARIIDVATLTGACVVALGTDVAGLMTNDDSWCEEVAAAAKNCGEPAWRLPMFPEYGDEIKSDVADIQNIGKTRWGGAITAAKFLEHFVGDVPWVHVDIAGPAFLDRPKPWQDAGGTGAFVRTLVEVARQAAQ